MKQNKKESIRPEENEIFMFFVGLPHLDDVITESLARDGWKHIREKLMEFRTCEHGLQLPAYWYEKRNSILIPYFVDGIRFGTIELKKELTNFHILVINEIP